VNLIITKSLFIILSVAFRPTLAYQIKDSSAVVCFKRALRRGLAVCVFAFPSGFAFFLLARWFGPIRDFDFLFQNFGVLANLAAAFALSSCKEPIQRKQKATQEFEDRS